jgi:hypothetical protein
MLAGITPISASPAPGAAMPSAGTATAATAAVAAPGSHYIRNEAMASAGKKALDLVRASVKLPEAARAGRLGTALLQTVAASPTTQLIDSTAPEVATDLSSGRSFTRFDRFAYRAAAGAEVGLAVFRISNGIPNVVRAVRAGGPAALIDTRTGRDGVLQTASGGLTLGLFGRAAGLARASGVRGVLPVTIAAATSETLTQPWVLGTCLGASTLVFANDHGFLDFLNKGNTMSVGQTEHTAWTQLGVRQKVENVGQHAEAPTNPGIVRRAGSVLLDAATSPE